MPGTPARSGGVILAGSGVLAIVTAGAGLAVFATATPAQATSVPLTVTPSVAMPGLPVTFTISCNSGTRSATLIGKTAGLSGPVSMKSTRGSVFAVTVNLPAGLAPGVYQAFAVCENGDYGTADLTVNAPPPPTPAPSPAKPTYLPPPTAAPVTGDGATSAQGGISGSAMAGLWVLGAGGLAGAAALFRLRKRRG